MEYKSSNPLRVFTAFSGYDSQCLALDRLAREYPEFRYDLVGWCDIDKNAIEAHNLLFPNACGKNYHDISKINWSDVPSFDLFTYSFPCTDISVAGKREGLSKGSGTRSSLLWECEKAIKWKRPKYLLMENVKALLSINHKKDYDEWVSMLSGYGYNSFCKVLDARDFGIPQRRERVFLISIWENCRESEYNFPQPFNLLKYIGEYIEDSVAEKYYIPERWQEITADKYPIGKDRYLLNAKNGIAPTITCANHYAGNITNPRQGFREMGVLECTDGKERVRRLTEREFFRLMGVDEESIDRIQSGTISSTAQLKLAGNSIVVDVLFHIFRKLLIEKEKEGDFEQLTLF